MDGLDRPRRIIAIVNAAAGPGTSKARFMEIRQSLHGEPFGSAYLTLRRGHGEEWARTFRHEAGYIVFGGEGTLHEVVSGMNPSTQAVSLVPLGWAVSLGRDLGLPGIAEACHGIETNRTGTVDMLSVILRGSGGKVRRCRAVSFVAIGWPAETAQVAARWRDDLGRFAYPAAAAALAVAPGRFAASVRIDGGRWRKSRLTGLLAGNTRHLMGMHLFPEASSCDGKMEVLECAAGPGFRIARGLAAAARLFLRLPVPAALRLSPIPARRLSVVLATPNPVAVDGERYDDVVRIEIRMLRGGLKLFLPAGA